uniref:Cytokine receptor-like factor 2-like D1 domain-containing protein n=1 Tax=Oryzias latipes TaxID=8090 RepID=A0A3P9ITY1_ORYLA
MLALLLLLFSLNGCLLAKEAPDVDCLVVNLEYVSCSWKKSTDGNYTFTSWFKGDTVLECAEYLPGNSTHTGCNRPYRKTQRFDPFYTVLKNGNDSSQDLKQEHRLQMKVKLNPPTNVTVKYGSDQNLWFYWNQTYNNCMESEVRHRKKQMKWEHSKVFRDQSYCINLPASNSRYELQVRIKLDNACGGGPDYWSEWSEPAIWGSNNSTDSNVMGGSMSVWSVIWSVMGAVVLILLVMMLLHHERLRVILIPVVPKPSLVTHDIEDWFQFSKNLKEGFKANYNERACPVREYIYVSQSDSDSVDSVSLSVSTDQTDCSVFMAMDEPKDSSNPLSSSTISSEEKP